ncbi:MAG: Lrp/AsnC family transcriptional regulator [Candidatus Thermoplasmatota archaeon]|nr:Lrp/AsnC family transcriptional regulator [Candidatus Thermoplasmatota archaeon]
MKDRKILYELDLYCRQSNAQIGKKVGLGRDVVSYRINKMENDGIIKNYWALIDTFRLGYDVFRIYTDFQYVSSDIKKEIIQYFVEYPYSWVVISAKSPHDLILVFWVKDTYEFYRFWDNTLDKFQDYFSESHISIYCGATVYKKSFLLPDIEEPDRKICEMRCGVKPVEIDETDYKLLNEIAVNARAPLIELSKKLNCSSQNVSYRIKKLIESGVINGLRVGLDLSKLGLQHYKVDLYLKEHKLKRSILKYLDKKSYIEYMNFSIGWDDLGPEFVVKNFEELSNIIDDINNTFSGVIKKQSFFIIDKVYKLRCTPELKFK